ncbi:acyltransferase [Anaeramoeba flamelloides]|uniref:Acyltransferase n=1 Tax=Anaeramoeba flamelloides TaxID=1746091 RepID=A0AAV7ZPQ7_9EUKA|nr:acyltransferase [Anaeramoeba flamelloides]
MKALMILLYVRTFIKRYKNEFKILVKLIIGSLSLCFVVFAITPNLHRYQNLTKLINKKNVHFLKYNQETGSFDIDFGDDANAEQEAILHGISSYFGFQLRFPVFILGCLVAYFQYRTQLVKKLKQSFGQRSFYLLFGIILFLLFFIIRITECIPDTIIGYEDNRLINILITTTGYFRFIHSIGFAIIFFYILNHIGLFGTILSKFLSLKIWIPLSNLSYSLYIMHVISLFGPIIQLIKTIQEPPTRLKRALMLIPQCLIGAYLVAFIVHLLIIKPFMNLAPKKVKFKQYRLADERKPSKEKKEH